MPHPSTPAGPTRRRLIVAGAAGAAALAARPALAQFRVEISGIGATQIPVAVALFRDEGAAPVRVSDVVRADLLRSGLFRLVDVADALDERSLPNLADWRTRGVDALVAGSVQPLADGRHDVRFKLWDVVRGEELVGQRQTVAAADLRLAAHRVADEIHQNLTGERGIFATRLAYVTQQGPRYQLLVTDADGEGAQVALASPDPIISPAWSPDGKSLAYVSFESQKAVVWVQEVASGRRRVLADFRGSNSAPAWSPDGLTIALALSRDGLTQLFAMPAAGGTPQRLTTSRAIDTEPVYTADGRSLYFVSDRGGGPQIYRMPASGGAAERVSFDGDYNISPSISPDGRTLGYVSRDRGGSFRLMTLELASGTVRTLTTSRDDESPSFAPNGRLLVYATRIEGRDVLMTTTLDGRIKTRLLTSGAEVREPAWGPFAR
ncbi:MAG: Tol-Pal system protein TolB [Burkholderiaceae bacterium]|nr:Tol-Pal system protein TolB [Burkholderiaceae bacterium]